MKACRVTLMLIVTAVLICASNVQAAYIIEAHSSGLANDHFTGSAGPYESSRSTAVGTTAAKSMFDTVAGDTFVFTYTPGYDIDNFMPGVGVNLGNGDLSTNMTGCSSGLFNVYITWPWSDSTNTGGVNITIANDDEDIYLPFVNMNVNGFGNPNPGNKIGNNQWLLLASNVPLTAGNTYTVTEVANGTGTGYAKIRAQGILWEKVADTPFPLSASVSEMTVIEGNVGQSYTLVMDSAPPGDVIYTVTASEPNQVWLNDSLNTTTVIFTPENWTQEKTVVVKAYDDQDVESDHQVILWQTTDLADPNDAPLSVLNGGMLCYITVDIIDNEAPGVQINEHNDATMVDEQGSTMDYYEMKLLFPPTANVDIMITTDGQTVVSASETGTPAATAQITFTAANWYIPQKVYVTAVDDDIRFENNHTSTIHHSISTTAAEYLGVAVADVIVDVADNECGVWGYSPYDFNEDCSVDLGDFAIFAAGWLDCSQPYVEGCVNF